MAVTELVVRLAGVEMLIIKLMGSVVIVVGFYLWIARRYRANPPPPLTYKELWELINGDE